MNESTNTQARVETCAARLEERRTAAAAARSAVRNLSASRLVVFLASAVALVPVLFGGALHWAWFALPTVAFAVLVLLHDRAHRKLDRLDRACRYHEAILGRLADRWAGQGLRGEGHLDAEHPYSADLDLFGAGSLFERLATTRTRAGERRLAGWLLAPTEPEEILERQAAVKELRDRLDLREDLAVLGGDAADSGDPAALAAWAEAPARLAARWPTYCAALLALMNVAALAGFFGGRPLAIVGLLPSALFAAIFHARARCVLVAAGRPDRELQLFSALLERLEAERFASRRLVRLRGVLDGDDVPPSRRIAALARLVETNESRHNMIFAPLAGLLLLGTQLAFALERWRARSGRDVVRWLDALAEFEALASLGGFAWETPGNPFPEIVAEGPPLFEADGLGHPLLPEATVVRNDVHLADRRRLLLISGSNMSGKSTFLRAVGVNVVLALAGAPVCARRLRLSPLALGACMRVQDSLQQGWSHFYAELRRLRQVADLAGGRPPLLFLLDEILGGTNSHDRRQGAAALLRDLIGRDAMGLVTTHDLALCSIADELAPVAENVHFVDHLEGERMVFDFLLRPGVVERSNALDLMRAVGLIR